jgi:hypothetical protein
MPKVDKLIVTNVTALRGKYGADGLTAIRRAVHALVGADAERGLTTRLLDLSSENAMHALRARHVEDALDDRENKEAVDGATHALAPDYLLILGAIDVVPHQRLLNPLFRDNPDYDDDRYALGDLPYACATPYGQRIEAFRGPTRVVGRLPDLTGAREPSVLLRLLGIATRYRTHAREAYDACFGLSAAIWRYSTAESLHQLGPSLDMLYLSPGSRRPAQGWSRVQLAPRLHFINCHGAAADPRFYGQRNSKSENFPTAHASRQLDGRVNEGTVVAAECCFGAELYDPSRHHHQTQGICYAYLTGGAYGFFGSSTLAYGPSRGNARADLICRYFLEEVSRGASLGRAALEARQRFVQETSLLHPAELKTLAQFSLLGDPSIHAAAHVPQALESTRLFKRAVAGGGALPPGRELRRDRLRRTGTLLLDTVGAVRRAKDVRVPATVRTVLKAAARQSGLSPSRARFMSFTAHDPAGRRIDRETRVRLDRPSAVHTVMGPLARRDCPFKRIVLISATVQNGRIVMLRRLHTR